MAAPFDRSRQVDQPGFAQTLTYLPNNRLTVLDIGCGNGRYGLFLAENERLSAYTGLDVATPLLAKAADLLQSIAQPIVLLERDMAQAGVLDDLLDFDLIVCLSALQHVPQRQQRLRLLREMKRHLRPHGNILLGNWQFIKSERQKRKIRPWSEIGLQESDVEKNDYLLTWQRGGFSYRYVCLIDVEETAALAESADLLLNGYFWADGREENLNLYTILCHK
jgi:SAM-dependent methyltransferase